MAARLLLLLASLTAAASLHVQSHATYRPTVSSFAPHSSPCCTSPLPLHAGGANRFGRTRGLVRIRGGAANEVNKWLASAGGLATSAIVTGAANLFGLAFTLATGSHKLTDLVGSGCFALSAVATHLIGGGASSTRLLASTSLITVWSIRLASFLFYRIMKTAKDDRLGKVFATTGGTVTFWFLSFLWGFVVLMPHSMSCFAPSPAPMDAAGYAAAGVAAVAFVVESVADWQKWCFKSGPDGKTTWCTEGLWKWSRHPNYAGEMSFWWSIFLLNAPNLVSPWSGLALGVVSPLFITLLIRYVSGVNLAEARNDDRFGDRHEYQAYKRETALLFPGLL